MEGYAAGELKHGPIALIDESMPVVVLAFMMRYLKKRHRMSVEAVARGGKVVMFTDKVGAANMGCKPYWVSILPETHPAVMISGAVPVHPLSLHRSEQRH